MPGWQRATSSLLHNCAGNVPHLDDKLFLVDNLHAQRKEVARLRVVVTGCIIALQGILVEELLDIVLIGNGEVRSRIVDQ